MTKSPKEVLNIDVTVSADTLKEDIFKIYSQLFKGVKQDEVEFEELQGGFVNSIYRVYLKKKCS